MTWPRILMTRQRADAIPSPDEAGDRTNPTRP